MTAFILIIGALIMYMEKYKSRAGHEGKNGEMKNHHGLDRAREVRSAKHVCTSKVDCNSS